MKIPPINMNDPSDIGQKFMVARHRKMMLEHLGVEKDEMPQGASEQIMMLKALKFERPYLYQKLYNLFVRGVEPDSGDQSGEKSMALSAQELEKAKREFLAQLDYEFRERKNEFQQETAGHHRNFINDLSERHKSTIEKFKSDAAEEIRKALQDVKVVEHHIKVADLPTTKTQDVLPKEFERIVHLAANRINVLLVGPSGCGKTHVSELVANSLGLPFYGQSCSAGMSESIFSGWLLPVEDGGKFEYVESPFVRAYENGGVFLFDEIDASDGNTLLFLNQALANKSFYLPIRHKNPVVKKHKDFVAIAAANTYGAGATSLYNSRNALDAASMDRFRMGVVEMDYSAEVEEKLVDPIILEFGREIRQVIKEKNLRKIMSTRFMLDATKMKAAGMSMLDIVHAYLSDWSKEEQKITQELMAKFSKLREAAQNEFQSGGEIPDMDVEHQPIQSWRRYQ